MVHSEDEKLLNDEFIERLRTLNETSPSAIPYIIIKNYLSIKNPSQKLKKMFDEWLWSLDNHKGKEDALMQIFEEEAGDKEKKESYPHSLTENATSLIK